MDIRTDDCDHCLYLEDLAVWTDYYVRGRYHNEYGYGGYGSTTSFTPKRIPGTPTDTSLSVVSSTELEVFFAPPSLPDNVDDIIKYTIQWDTTETFENATSSLASCSSGDFGACNVSGTAIVGTPPFSYLIEGLVPSTTYYVRIAARNSIAPQQVDPDGQPPDNTNWSGTMTASLSDQVPTSPVSVTGQVSGPTQIQLAIQPPTRTGGQTIFGYLIEWDSSTSFSSSSGDYGQLLVNTTEMTALYEDGPWMYELASGLVEGTSYYVKVAARSSVGLSPFTYASSAFKVTRSPYAPASVSTSTLESSSEPITSIDVAWSAPSQDGGSSITGYMVEWWTDEVIYEVQEIRLSFDVAPSTLLSTERSFLLSFGPSSTEDALTTSTVYYTTTAENLRDRLINLGFSEDRELIGDIIVSKEVDDNSYVYSWFVTFIDASINPGDQIALAASLQSGSSDDASVQVIEVQSGQRSGGSSEVQILQVESTDGVSPITNADGWFRLSFEGSNYTHYLPVDVEEEEMVRALEHLDVIDQVNVTKETGTNSSSFTWYVTFEAYHGDIMALYADTLLLSSDVTFTVYDGDNSIDSITHVKKTEAIIGEKPVDYDYALVDALDRAYTIPNLVPGQSYHVQVTAKNVRGYGEPLEVSSSTTLPLQVPGTPLDVTLSVSEGNFDQLDISYDAPASDGGASIMKYRVELDIVDEFTDPIVEEIHCPSYNLRTVYSIELESTSSSNYVYNGSFTLQLDVNGYSYEVDPFAYDLVPMATDENGLEEEASFTVSVAGSSVSVTGTNILVFPGTRVRFANQMNASEYYTVNTTDYDASSFYVDRPVDFTSGASTSGIAIYRVYAGRGLGDESYIHCLETSDDSLCPTSRTAYAGSVESKLISLTDAISAGVLVDRTEPSETNGFTWLVTFLDDSPTNPYDYTLSLSSNDVMQYNPTTESYSVPDLTVSRIVDGEVYASCTGTQVVPSSGGLINGQSYFARVFAINSEGYSSSQIASSSEKPQVVPGKPTSVILSVASATELEVQWNAPDDNGGDTITEYIVEYDTTSDFLTASSSYFTDVTGGSPFHKVLLGLDQGVDYYVRVRAVNSQGSGDAQASTPSYLNPHEEPSAPTNVELAVTSDSMLTVFFDAPENDGGDTITSYRVEWDTVSTFNGASSEPHKGYEDVDATTNNAYTLEYLSSSTTYYVRVAAINSAGVGTFATTTPTGAATSNQVPGTPHTVTVSAGTTTGYATVSWQRPRIPHHGIPCSGTLDDPDDCPNNLGGDTEASDGGSDIIEYEVEYNEKMDFTGADGDSETTTGTTFTLTTLTSNRLYYIRVLARNAIGSGSFCEKSGADFCDGSVLSVTAP
jgi:hypothetical protein